MESQLSHKCYDCGYECRMMCERFSRSTGGPVAPEIATVPRTVRSLNSPSKTFGYGLVGDPLKSSCLLDTNWIADLPGG